MLEICVQSDPWYKESDPEWSFRYIHDCGFEAIDYNIDDFMSYSDLKAGNWNGFFSQTIEELQELYRPAKEAAKRHNVRFSLMHAPFPLYIENREDINDYLIMSVDKCCALCQFLECPALVVHPYTHPDKETEKEINLQMYRRMMPSAKRYGVTLCLENMFEKKNGHFIEASCADVAEVCWYIDTLNEEAGEEIFGFCLDIGHANMLGRNLLHYIKGLGKRLTTLHIHDNTGDADAHLIPYTQNVPGGGVDWNGFIEGLREIGYEGPLSFETFRGIRILPDEVKTDGLRLVSSIGRYFRKRISEVSQASL